MKICVVSVTKNEEKILPFFLDYYQNFVGVDKIILYDGNSTDNTIKIAKENEIVELIVQNHEKCDERDLMWVRNESWKKIRNDYDWIIVCDADEFLYHPEIRTKLKEYQDKGITIPLVEGFDMISDIFPEFKKGNFLTNIIKTGNKDANFLNKKLVFNPRKVDINYEVGCHGCNPTGDIVWGDKEELKLLHYKWLSYEYVTKKTSYQYNRLSEYSLTNNYGIHNKYFSETPYNDFHQKFLMSGNVITGRNYRMRYQDVDGWFDFENIYEEQVKKEGDNKKFLELGAWLGKSTSFMAEVIKESNKNIEFNVVDHWLGDPNIGDLKGRFPNLVGNNVFPLFEQNVGDLIKYMNVITAESEEAANKFPDKYFDFIFLDATKIYEDVLRDIKIWYPKIKDDGVFGGHDYFSWAGVRQAVDQFAKENNLIVKTNKSSWILEKNINIFWHCYLINNWIEIFQEQINLIIDSGLYNNVRSIQLYFYGDDEQMNILFRLINKYDPKNKIITHYIRDNFYEYPTIQELHKFSQNNNSYVLYLHLKGVWSSLDTSKNREAIISWRKCLEYFNVEKWKDCIGKLKEGFEVVGALYNYNEQHPLFSGNIWWSTTDYIKKLKYPEYDPNKNPNPNDDGTWCRVECEKWINTIPNKYYNFYIPKDYGFYYVPIQEKDYRKKDIKISVIIPTYNRLDALTECIESVIKQNYQNLEILVCHDGPSEMFDSYKFDDDRVFYYHTETKENKYGTHQRNMLLKKVTGDYVLYLDDDNILYPDYFEKMISNIEQNTAMLICRIHFNDSTWVNLVLPREDKIIPCQIDSLNVLIRSDIATKIEWDSMDIGHDHRYIQSCEKIIIDNNLGEIKYIPDVLGNHRYLGSKSLSDELYILYNSGNLEKFTQIKNKKMLLLSKDSIDFDIQSQVDFVIIDKRESVLDSIYNAINFGKSVGFNKFVCVTTDYEIDPMKIENKLSDMIYDGIKFHPFDKNFFISIS